MQVNTIPLLDEFGKPIQFEVPFFQRPYVWDVGGQWQPLWEDILRIYDQVDAEEEDPHHFLGAIIINPPRRPSVYITKMQVIDGQQRLITLQILLSAFRDIAKTRKWEEVSSILKTMVKNPALGSEVVDDQLKILPAIPDRAAFREIILSTRDVQNSKSKLFKAYHYFYRSIDEFCDKTEVNSAIVAKKLLYALREGLKVVKIELGDEDDPQVIFESLNARSQPLTAADLIKSFLVAETEVDNDQLERYYDETDSIWMMFLTDYWRENVSLGGKSYQRIDAFLFHFLSMKLKREARIPELYRDFVKWYNSVNRDPLQIMEEIKEYGLVYRSFDNKTSDTPDGAFFQKLRTLKFSTAHPLLLYVYGPENPDLPDADRLSIIANIESLIIRRALIYKQNKDYLKYFCSLLAELNEFESLADQVESFLIGNHDQATRWPHDYELGEQLETEPITSNIGTVVLRALAQADPSSNSLQNLDNWKVEYLMPKDWVAYPEQWGVGNDLSGYERRKTLVTTIGNMTLVSRKLTKAQAGLPWIMRRDELISRGNTPLNSTLPTEWSDHQIEDRTERLAQQICGLWPRPEQGKRALPDNKEE